MQDDVSGEAGTGSDRGWARTLQTAGTEGRARKQETEMRADILGANKNVCPCCCSTTATPAACALAAAPPHFLLLDLGITSTLVPFGGDALGHGVVDTVLGRCGLRIGMSIIADSMLQTQMASRGLAR